MKYSKLLSSIILVIVLSACTSKEIQAETLIKESEVQTATAHDSSAPRYTKTAKIPLSQLHGHFEYNVADFIHEKQFPEQWNFRMIVDYQPKEQLYVLRSKNEGVDFTVSAYMEYLTCFINDLSKRNQAKSGLLTWDKRTQSRFSNDDKPDLLSVFFSEEGMKLMLSPDDLTKQIPTLKKRYPNWELSKEMVSDVRLDNAFAKEVCRLYQSPFADN